VRDAAHPLVVAHGLWLSGAETWLLRRRLRVAGFAAHVFHFRSVRADLDTNAAALARFLTGVASERVDVVGHSLGGVVAVHLLEQAQAARVGRVVCLGSPLNGTESGRRLAALPGGRYVLGRSVLDLNARGGLAPWPGRVDLGIIAGSAPAGFGRLLGRLPKPHDGTVAVEETRLEGATDHVVVPVSHTTLVLSKRVADLTIRFLRTGRFRE
jgi:pimeloyl-ACP methyl ester carboxylesterase